MRETSQATYNEVKPILFSFVGKFSVARILHLAEQGIGQLPESIETSTTVIKGCNYTFIKCSGLSKGSQNTLKEANLIDSNKSWHEA